MKKERKAVREKKKAPFGESHALRPMVFATVIVNDGQASSIGKMILASGASFFLSMHGKGTASSDFYEVFGFGNQDKRAFFACLPSDAYLALRRDLAKRFAVSNYAKGIAFTTTIQSFVGVAAYRFAANLRYLESKKETTGEEKKMDEGKYACVYAIVNDGYTDIVMEAAKKAGARGGTILTAHGTGNKEMEHFFGIAITPEKEMVLILVKEEIKNAVMEAIYRDAGISTKGQGIVFSMPISDALGLSGEESAGEGGQGDGR